MKANLNTGKLTSNNFDGNLFINRSIVEMRNKDMQQKVTVINDVIKSIRNNPKFIKLLFYSMNSLENFVSPPNKQIRINAKIIIKRINKSFIY